MKKRYLLTLLIIVGIIFSYFYEPSLESLIPQAEIADTTRPLNFYLEDLETRTFNTEGVHTYTLNSIYAVQHVGEKQVILDKPIMHIALHMAPWTATAEKGISSDNQKKITLSDGVRLSRTDGNANVRTEILVLDSQDEVAYTQSAVEILAYGSKTTADGVFVDLTKEVIHLKDNVNTYYVPEAARSRRPQP